jgi:hypothetical protein
LLQSFDCSGNIDVSNATFIAAAAYCPHIHTLKASGCVSCLTHHALPTSIIRYPLPPLPPPSPPPYHHVTHAQIRLCDVGVVAAAQGLPRLACLDISMCTKFSEAGLKTLSSCCKAMLRLVRVLINTHNHLTPFSRHFQDVCGCSLLRRQAIVQAAALLVDAAIKSSLSDENALKLREERWVI